MIKILVIDDEANIVRLVRDNLEPAGYRVLTASNAETGLHALRRGPEILGKHPDFLEKIFRSVLYTGGNKRSQP